MIGFEGRSIRLIVVPRLEQLENAELSKLHSNVIGGVTPRVLFYYLSVPVE